MRNFLVTLMGIVTASASAFADDTSSEYFYQAKAGETYVETNLNYRALTADNDGTDTDFTDIMLNAYAEYGFNKTYSGYVSLGYGQGERETENSTIDFKGVDMVYIGAKYNRYSETDRFLGRAQIGYGLEESGGENRVGNEITLNLALGYEKHISDQDTAGILASYTVLATDTKFENSADEANKGNLDITGYMEHKIEDFIYAYKLSYSTGGLYYFQGYHAEDLDFSFVTLGAYTRVPMSENFYLLANLDYKMSLSEPGDFQSLDGFDVSLGGRLLF